MDGIYWIQRDIPHWTNILQVYLCSLRHRFVGGWHLPAALGNSYLHLFLLHSHHVNSSYEVLGDHFVELRSRSGSRSGEGQVKVRKVMKS